MPNLPATYPVAGNRLLSLFRGDFNDSIAAVASMFHGTDEPTVRWPGQLRANVGTGWLEIRKSDNTSWLQLAKLDTAFGGLLPLTGGIMQGAIDMGGFALTNLGAGSGTSAARQQDLALKAPLDAPVFTGDARVSQDPAGNDSIPRKIWTEGRYLKLSGGTLTGILTLFADAAADMQAVTRRQLRDFTAFNTTTGHGHTGGDSRKVLGTNLDTTGASAGTYLEANGSGGAAFTSPPKVAFKTPVKVVARHAFNSGNFPTVALSWRTINLTGKVSSSTRSVYCYMRILHDSGQTAWDTGVAFRPQGASTTFANAMKFQTTTILGAVPALDAEGVPSDDPTAPTGGRHVWIPLSSGLQFDFLTQITDNNNNFGAAFWLLAEG